MGVASERWMQTGANATGDRADDDSDDADDEVGGQTGRGDDFGADDGRLERSGGLQWRDTRWMSVVDRGRLCCC
ncbi:hypothetical protein ACLOJK_040515 [Asimina triloba]